MGPCQISCLWMQPILDHEPYRRHVLISIICILLLPVFHVVEDDMRNWLETTATTVLAKWMKSGNTITGFALISCEDAPVDTSSSSRLLHSWRNKLAPVKLPSPPMHTRFVMPLSSKLNAARRRPSRSRKSLQRALPITVPPYRYTWHSEIIWRNK